ncbi:MAG: nucleotidyltransferase family protein [Nitrospira sp.]
MKAMILAAGLGTRLRPLTNTIPKPLLPSAARLIVWNLLLLKRHGFRDVVINLHHLGPMIEQALGDGSRFGLRLIYSHEPVILGTGGGIKQAELHFSGEPVLILNGDTLFELDLGALCSFHRERKALATLVLREDPEAVQWGLVEVGAGDRIVRINGKGASASGPVAPRMFAGVHSSSEGIARRAARRGLVDHRSLRRRHRAGRASARVRSQGLLVGCGHAGTVCASGARRDERVDPSRRPASSGVTDQASESLSTRPSCRSRCCLISRAR